MGRYKLQQMLNKRLGENAVILDDFSKNPLDRTKVKDKDGVVKDVSFAAMELKYWLENPVEPYSDEELEDHPVVIWHDYLNMSDEELCLNFKDLHRYYAALKAKGNLGSDAKEAEAVIEIVNAHMALMSDIYYDLLDPGAFDDIPSKVLDDIISNPDFMGDESELYDNANDNLRFTSEDLLDYLKSAAERNRALEKFQRIEISNTLNTQFESTVENIIDLSDEYEELQDNDINPERQEEILKELVGNLRLLLGAGIVLQEARDKVPMDYEVMDKLTSEKNLMEATKDVSDQKLVALIDEYGAEEFFELLQDGGPLEENPGAGKLLELYNNEPAVQKRHWFNDLKAQLKDMGIDNPMAMNMLRVRGDADPSEFNTIPFDFDGALRAFQLMDASSIPALMPVDASGKLVNPLMPGENPAEWTYENMPDSLDDVSDAQIDFLYRMAQENRLLIRPTDTTEAGYAKNRYISVSEDNTAHVSKNLHQLQEDLYNNPVLRNVNIHDKDALDKALADPTLPKFDGYDAKTLMDIIQADGDMISCEQNCEIVSRSLDNMYMSKLFKEAEGNPEKLEHLNYMKDVYLEQRNARIGFRKNCIHATRSGWYKDYASAREMTDIYTSIEKPEELRTEEEKSRVDYNLLASDHCELIEKGLLKLTNCDSIQEVMESGRVKFGQGKPLADTSDIIEFMHDVTTRMYKNEEIFVDGNPVMYGAGFGLKPGVNKEAYSRELNFLVSRLTKTEGNLTSNTPAYDSFSKAAKEMAELVRPLSDDTQANFDALIKKAEELEAYKNQYFADHRNHKLDSRQISRVTAMNRFMDLIAEIKDRNTEPGKNLDYRLAEKIVTAATINQLKKPELLMNAEYRKNSIEATLKDRKFRSYMDSLMEYEKEDLLKVPGKKVLKMLTKHSDEALEQEGPDLDESIQHDANQSLLK